MSTQSSAQELIEAAKRDALALEAYPDGFKLPADAVGGFEIIEELGRGGMGVVYRARQLSTKRVVALKVMLAGCFSSQASRRRFQREIELSARLQHPWIVRVLESGQTRSNQPYFAMDYVDGLPMDCWLASSAPDRNSVLRMFCEMCDALEHAHERGVVHRDLKPANVFIDDHGKPHILDFGLAKALDAVVEPSQSAEVSETGHVLGTLRYLSPEQARGAPSEVDARTDVYGVGLMLYEMLTGTLPVDATGSPCEVLQRICEDLPTPPSTLNSCVDRELEAIVLRSLEKDRCRRFQSAGDLASDLHRYLNGEPVSARAPSSFYIFRKRLLKQRALISAGVGAALLCVVGIGVGVSWRESILVNEQRAARSNARREILEQQRRMESGEESVAKCLAPVQTLLARFPELVEARLSWIGAKYRLGRATGDQQAINAAIAALRQDVERGPQAWAFQPLLREILAERNAGSTPSGWSLDAGDVPATADAWFVLSYATMDATEAIRRAERGRGFDPTFSLARERLLYLYEQRDQFDRALQEAQWLVDFGETPAKCLLLQARILIKARRFDDAVAKCTSVLDVRPGWDNAYRYRALARQCAGDHSGAVRDYTKAIGVSGGSIPWERYYRATSLWALGRHREAADDYRAVAEEQGGVFYERVRLFLVLSDWCRKLECAGDAAGANKARTEAALVMRKAREGAREQWIRAILACLAGEYGPEQLVKTAEAKSANQLCEAYYYAGESCLLRGLLADAQSWFQKCVETDLIVDPGAGDMAPMNEFHLARWRLQQIGEQAWQQADRPDEAEGV